MDKRDRAQKLKRDKRSKDAKRGGHGPSNKSENKPSNAEPKPPVGATKDQKDDGKTNKESAQETKETPLIDFSKLKRETDEISQLNKTYSKREVTSNWSKYEAPLPPEDDEVISKGADFESLLGAPISEGGHFKFKSEAMWSENPLQFNEIFSLDVKRVAKSISRIPFYEQIGLSKELFSKEEIEQMDKEAKQNSERYKTSLDEPVVNNVYEVLKSSLIDHATKMATEKKLGIKTKSVEMEASETDSSDDIQISVVLPMERKQHDNDLYSSSETYEMIDRPEEEQDITLSLPKREKAEMLSKDTTEVPVTQDESNPSDSLEGKDISKKAKIPSKKNSVLEKPESHTDNILSEIKPLTNNSPTNQNKADQAETKPNLTEFEDDELDFLLTLKQPVSGPKYTAKVPSKPAVVDDILNDDLGALSLSTTTETKEDLEDWLDSMLAE